jgi:hypothetical protein
MAIVVPVVPLTGYLPEAAIHPIYQKLDRTVCAGCERRIFRECRP